MEPTFPGPFCRSIGLSYTGIEKRNFPADVVVTNGLVIELYTHINEKKLSAAAFVKLLCHFDKKFNRVTHPSSVISKVARISEQKKKLGHKKKVKGFKNVDELLSQIFTAPISKVADQTAFNNDCNDNDIDSNSVTSVNTCDDNAKLNETITQIQNISVNDEPQSVSVGLQTNFECNESENEISRDKNFNWIKYEISKLQKHRQKLENTITQQKNELVEIGIRKGHYSVRNVNKRDETAKKNLHLLRDNQRVALRQDRQLKDMTEKLKETIKTLRHHETEVEQLNVNINCLEEEISSLKMSLKQEKAKKLNTQKSNSYLKNETILLRTKLKDNNNEHFKSEHHSRCMSCRKSDSTIQEKEIEINELKDKVDDLQSEKVETKSNRKCFRDEMRLCVIELSGLEVAVEKVPEVIRTVSKHLHNKEFEKDELPTSSTIQLIVDEGHFLAKTFISQKLSESENWGLNRDGTTRRKEKILDTAVTLDSGKVVSLGFTKVAQETAVTINEITKSHINELANLNSNLESDLNKNTDNDTYIKSSLDKLSFTMSDRASNEKKASDLLNEWRAQVLDKNSENYSKVNTFHCMAHVLLGFHSYICKDLTEHEKLLSAEHGPLGRDSLACFKFWSKKKTVVERVLKTTSDVFGPSGDYHGVRDLWEAHCASKGIKSVIGNYKDNRFNGMFQTAAEIYLHRHDFVKVLETVKSPNLLLKSVLADLKSDIIMTLLQALGLFYINLTGPYWNLVIGNKVPYLQLHTEVSLIRSYLEDIETEPAVVLKTNHWCDEDSYEISHVPYKQLLTNKLKTISENSKKVLFDTVKLAASAIKRTVEKQLVDFLPEGRFSAEASNKDLQRTRFAPLTNIGCEHHFGSLDSRRPRASLHHHSSVQLIKQNRSEMVTWLIKMPECDRKKLLKTARKGGKELRQKHREEEVNVLTTINENVLTKSQKTSKKKNKKRKAELEIMNEEKRQQCDESESYSDYEEESKLLDSLPDTTNIIKHDYVAVAYQDTWYPGVVKEVINTNELSVRFMTPTNKPGVYKWPTRDDTQTVEKTFIVLSGFIPDCISSGRLWEIKKYPAIDNIYAKYSKIYF